MQHIQVVLVIYKMPVQASPSYGSLIRWLDAHPGRARFDLLVADNSPEPQAVPPGARAVYLHDGINAGLAGRYNLALHAAADSGAAWLLLLDQDTTLTDEYFEELLELAERFMPQTDVVGIVPKLTMDGRVLSPHAPRFRARGYEVTPESYGVLGKTLRVFNSAALLRVSALEAIGGFPPEYWLDYLDHATCHRMQERGGRIFVMHTVLEHELSDARTDRPQSPERLLNRLRAEERFHREHAALPERLLHRFDLLRQVVGWGRRGHFQQAMVRLRVLLHWK